MSTPKLTSLTLIVAFLTAAITLQACNTVSGIGKDVSAGADAVTEAAEEEKNY